MWGKRGQGLSTSAIVLMVLGVIVLVVLAVGFTIGFNKLAPWLSSNNVNTIVTTCSVACSIESTYDFCSLERTLRAADLPSGEDEVKGTCLAFSRTPYIKYGIGICSKVNCDTVGGIVHASLIEAQVKCVKSGNVLRYIDGNSIEQAYSCLSEDLAGSETGAMERCSQLSQEIIWFDGINSQSYICGTSDLNP